MSSRAEIGGPVPAPVMSLQYKDISTLAFRDSAQPADEPLADERDDANKAPGFISETDLAVHLEIARAEAARETEQRLRGEYEQKLLTARAPIAESIQRFGEQRSEYYARVEAEVVQLALAIAAKILHREAQVDPMLVAALVRIAIEQMREGSSVTVRVSPGRVESWKRYFAGLNMTHVEVAGDVQLNDHDCLLDTELGSANFGLEAQLKEVEQGFFDLLALRPKGQ